MYDTKYHKASDVADAVRLMGSADDGKFISGGQTLIPTMKARLAAPSDLVDLNKIEDMKGVTVSDGKVRIGAATTHTQVAGDAALSKACPGLAALASGIGDQAVRNVGTIGGSIANNDPAADYPSAILALGATINTSKRNVSADDFFTGMFETALDEDEIVVSIEFDAPEKSAYAKFPNPASRYALVGVFVAKTSDGARVAVTGAGSDGVFRAAALEEALGSNWSGEALADVTVESAGLMTDMHADAKYRANLVKVMAGRAIDAAR